MPAKEADSRGSVECGIFPESGDIHLRHAGLISLTLLAGLSSFSAVFAQQCSLIGAIAAAGSSIGTPGAMAIDITGKLYFTAGNCVMQVDLTNGMLTRVAGNSTGGYTGDGAAAMSAQLNGPGGLTTDLQGDLYISDTGNHSVRVVTPGGTINTVAGSGTPGYSGDGGPASSASFNGPSGLAADRFGNLYIADTNNSVVRRIAASGTISTYAGLGTAGYSYDGFFAREAALNLPAGLAVSSGNLYISDSGNNRIRLVTAAHLITTFAGNGVAGYSGDDGVGGQSEDAELNLPTFVASDPLGLNVYISDSMNKCIRQVLPDTIITTAAGGTKGTMGVPGGIALDSSGNLYIADTTNGRILKLTPAGKLTTIAGK
jgi:sugar lactone lactonase YvrE